MLSDYELFNQLCTKRKICAPLEVSEAMKVASSTGELQLPCLSIIMPVCEVIGRVLASSSIIKSVNLSDCMLASKGLTAIFNALCEGTNIISLNLKGNNITGATAVQLGNIFHYNNTLKCLHLEWNNLGSDIEAFKSFCKGLCANYNIEELDLRYNQITPHCAEALSGVLRNNKSLQILNLAWNTLGLQGGQLLLKSMAENSSIIKLSLHGNCVPDEIIKAIDNYTFKNQSKKIVSQLNISPSAKIVKAVLQRDFQPMINCENHIEDDSIIIKKRSKEKRRLKEYKKNSYDSENSDVDSLAISLKILEENSQMNELGIPNIDVTEKKNNSKEMNEKISALNQILQDRIATVNNLTDELAIKNAEIDAAKLSIINLQSQVDELKDDHAKFVAEKTKEITDLKEAQKVNEENLNKMYKELAETHKTVVLQNKEWEAKSHRYERDIHASSLEIHSLRERWIHDSQKYKDTISASKMEILKVKKDLKEKENVYKLEVNVLKNTLRETTQACEECQAQLQKTRAELQEKLANLSHAELKLNKLEQISTKYNKLIDSFERMKEEKALLEENLSDSQRSIASLKRQVGNLQSELIEPQRRYDLLKDELNQEKDKSARLKQDLSEERSRLAEQNVQIQKMNQQITTLNSQINEIRLSHAEDVKGRDKDVKHLKEIIANKELEFQEYKANEAQRAGQLYAAFSKYLGSIGPTT